MGDGERGDLADWDLANEVGADPGCEPEPSAEGRSRRRWSAEEKARIVRESFWPGQRVSEVARRYGVSKKLLSAWRGLARQGKLALPSSSGSEPEPMAAPDPAFAAVEVDEAAEPGPGSAVSVSIEARGVTVRLDGDIGARRIAEIACLLRALR